MNIIKGLGKTIVLAILSAQVKRLQAKNKLITIGVVGSYGKTSTKFAVAEMLSQKYKVRFQKGNYNDIVSVPLIFFGQSMPSLLNPLAWIVVFIRNELQIMRPYRCDVVVLEIGTDGPGQIAAFKRYLDLDYAVLTSIGEEHMEFFKDLREVAAEERSVSEYSRTLIYNSDLCDQKYLKDVSFDNWIPFGFQANQDKQAYQITDIKSKNLIHNFKLTKNGSTVVEGDFAAVSKTQAYSIAAASILGLLNGMEQSQILDGIKAIKPVSGRMQILRGINGSTILDETYNSSPDAARAALDVIHNFDAKKKIALLGSMNELGKYSATLHKEIGQYCNPKKLDLVLTLGAQANKYLAPAARKKGCQVMQFDSPIEAGNYLKDQLDKDTVLLAKGSQNGVYAEEAIKLVLLDPEDSSLLVRQSGDWLKTKKRYFDTI